MALIEVNRHPSQRELQWFGAGLILLAALLGGMTLWRTGQWDTARVIWGLGAALALVYFSVPPLRRPIYLVWCYAALPIGWMVSHAVLALAFYLVITPIGVLRRAVRRDPLGLAFERDRTSYWIARKSEDDVRRYFRQF